MREFVDEAFDIAVRGFGINFELGADVIGHDLRQRGKTVRRLPDYGGHRIQGKESGIGGRHDHHLAAQQARGDGGTFGDVFRASLS